MIRPTTPGEWDTAYHAPVLIDEILELVGGRGLVLDGTVGGGGHSAALLESGSMVVALDRDPAAIHEVTERLGAAVVEGRFVPVLANYADIAEEPIAASRRFDGILLDLGISSRQIDDPARGFTFREGAPLDMRMGDDAVTDATTLLETYDEQSLAGIFRELGDERRAIRLAREVVRRRERGGFATSDDFVGAIRAALGPRSGPGDFARLFQAVRIAVNRELEGLQAALPLLRDRLAPDGLLLVIAYHSGEDRIVKHAFRAWDDPCVCPPRQPVCTCGMVPLGRTVTRRPIVPSDAEIERNPRARSARMRVWRRGA